MERKRHGREFKLEAVKLVRERGVSVAHPDYLCPISENRLEPPIRMVPLA